MVLQRPQVLIPRVYLLQFGGAHGIKLSQERTVSFYLTKIFMLTSFNSIIYPSKAITKI